MLNQGLMACEQVLAVAGQYPEHWRAAALDLKSSLLYRLADVEPESTAILIAAARAANDESQAIYTPTDHADLAEVWLTACTLSTLRFTTASMRLMRSKTCNMPPKRHSNTPPKR